MKISTVPQFHKRPRGVALLVALLVVALAAVLIAALLDRGELTAARTRNALRLSQAEAYAQGLEAYAAHVLERDLADGSGNDTAADIWAVPLPPTPVPGGEISATMGDLDGRFNLNNLSPAYPQNAVWRGKFVRLLGALKLDPNLADAVREWMSNDPAGATDAYYLAQPVPYRSSKNIFFHISELRLVKGVDGDVYARLAPYVSALPPGTPINVNTASVPVLMTLYPDMTQQMAQALWQEGHASYQLPLAAALQQIVPAVQIDCGSNPISACYGVSSSYFVARGRIVLDGLPFTFFSLIERGTGPTSGGIRVIQRSRGADG
ncbi:MAG TPA: type II secretion system minor pseudopilin GspK [Rudaea sp.]|nr:type II secretion system minor pseudopilin GspK [Rudaea sp.]